MIDNRISDTLFIMNASIDLSLFIKKSLIENTADGV